MCPLCLCVFVVRFTRSPAGLYLRIHFTHQTQESSNSHFETILRCFSDLEIR
ncbi:hypothetical protein C789_3974 [Microcystis aeruginosa FACHB-905 = DIANCHI905]|uniref:Uncharacterized protein n=1 Tax=Microcystis aeruginosa PCC 7806SL TaxID=1903187 RepID=A0AB33BPE2_MICA7|nr:hypothetical protein BH695_2915 [Microcystis aeruginosa PCC 7806SL]ELS46218.1 hypothetical protein C789_3974 [Microcystis aeruginosa FACHB-905 = DIANCHI905]